MIADLCRMEDFSLPPSVEESDAMTRPRWLNIFTSGRLAVIVLIVSTALLCVDSAICNASEIQNSDGSITVSVAIADGADDAVEKIDSGFNQLNYKYVYPGTNLILGYRFSGIDVPANAEIVSATLVQYASGYGDRSVRLKYTAEASAEPVPFTGDAFDLSGRPRILNNVVDTPGPWPKYDFFSGPDLASIIQEIVDDPQWRRGGTMVLFAEDADSGSIRKTDQFEYDSEHAARIEITYLPGKEQQPSDIIPPEVHILTPAPDYQTDLSTVDLTGTASDDSAIASVDWGIDGGGSGSAQGTDAWSVSNVPLHDGANVITVQAFDKAGNAGEISLTVYRVESPPKDASGAQRVMLTISKGADDSFEKLYNNTNSPGTAILIGKGYQAGFRFQDVGIPVGSVIIRATLQLYCYAGESKKIHIRYRGEAVATSAPFSLASGDISSRKRTVSEVSEYAPAWAGSEANASPDLKEIIQEIIDQPGWQIGNTLSLFVEDIDSTQYRNITNFENDPTMAAALEIEYVPFLGSKASISAQPTQISAGETVEFSAEFTDPDNVLDWLWRFGDGGTSTDMNPVHYYETPGTYPTRFEYTDIYNNHFYKTIEVRVLPVTDTSLQVFEGFGENATGGEGFPTLIAGSPTEFAGIISQVKAAGGNAVILLEGEWTYSANVSLAHLSNVTINGMNASVAFDGTSLYLIDCDNIILQGLRIRKHQTGDDCIQVNSCRNVVIDHCSVSRAGDGNIDITGWSYGPSYNITVSWCILADTWKQSLVKYNGTTNITFHHNLFYNGGGRFPHLSEGKFDIRNNMMYQWASYGLVLTDGARANIINNSFIISPTSTRGHAAIWYLDSLSKAWIGGNLLPAAETDVSRLSAPLNVPTVATQSAPDSEELILNQVGALPRDAYDQSVIQMVRDHLFPSYPPYHD